MVDLLAGGTALITGAGSGIGRATALCFARDGCHQLVLGDLSMNGLQETQRLLLDEYPTIRTELRHLDVGDEESVEEIYKSAVDRFGRIDFVANVAGYAHPAQPVTDITLEQYEKSVAVNIRGVFMSQRSALRQMVKQDPLPGFQCRGSIVNVGSLSSTIAMPGLSVYSGTKGAVLGLTKTDALDYGPEKIRLNMVAPGNTITPMLQAVMGEHYMEHFAANTPLRRLAEPEDIANAVLFLSSPRAAYISGVNLPVDGGMSLATGPP